MKILDINSFIKESSMRVERVVNDDIHIMGIDVKCRWDGEHWYFYDREGKGTHETFKSLPQHRNVDFEMNFKIDFAVTNEMLDDEIFNDCTVDIKAVLHYYDMASDDYDIEVRSIDDVDELKNLFMTYSIDARTFDKFMSESWYDCDVIETLSNEMEDRMGFKKPVDLIEKIRKEITNAIFKQCINKQQ